MSNDSNRQQWHRNCDQLEYTAYLDHMRYEQIHCVQGRPRSSRNQDQIDNLFRRVESDKACDYLCHRRPLIEEGNNPLDRSLKIHPSYYNMPDESRQTHYSIHALQNSPDNQHFPLHKAERMNGAILPDRMAFDIPDNQDDIVERIDLRHSCHK